jgi:hypothetical protein
MASERMIKKNEKGKHSFLTATNDEQSLIDEIYLNHPLQFKYVPSRYIM